MLMVLLIIYSLREDTRLDEAGRKILASEMITASEGSCGPNCHATHAKLNPSFKVVV